MNTPNTSNVYYERVNWEDGTTTPINAANLNKADEALYYLLNDKTGEFYKLKQAVASLEENSVIASQALKDIDTLIGEGV